MTHPDYRSLCAELADKLHEYATANPAHDTDQFVDRVRAALAAPQQGPTLDDISELCDEFDFPLEDENGDLLERGIKLWEMANALIACYGAQAAPVAVAERLPGAGDCDAKGRCWVIGSLGMWIQVDRHKVGPGWIAWLPHWALPLPRETHS